MAASAAASAPPALAGSSVLRLFLATVARAVRGSHELLALLLGFLVRDRPRPTPASTAAAAPAARLPLGLFFLGLLELFRLLEFLGLRSTGLRRRDGERVGRARAAAVPVGLEVVIALEPREVVDGDVELVGDPGVRAALPHPHTNLVQLGAQGRLSSQIDVVRD